MEWIIVIVISYTILIIIGVFSDKAEQNRIVLMTPDEKEKYLKEEEKKLEERENQLLKIKQDQLKIKYGSIKKEMICPHCQTKGKIRTKNIKQKKGISGGKAVATILTGGLSILAVGLSRKESVTQAHCGNCKNTWVF